MGSIPIHPRHFRRDDGQVDSHSSGRTSTNATHRGRLTVEAVVWFSPHLNFVTSYTYDPSGNKLTQIDGRTYTTTYAVDDLSRVAKVTDANSNAVQTNYSLAGEVVSTINARGKTNLNTLDRLGRVTGVSYFKADGVTALSQNFGYDADSNRTSFADTDVAQTTVTYDHLNRVSTVTAPSPLGTTSYAYFLDGALNTVTDATGTTTFTQDRRASGFIHGSPGTPGG